MLWVMSTHPQPMFPWGDSNEYPQHMFFIEKTLENYPLIIIKYAPPLLI